jgi:predicted HTH transcriptional regulator
MTVVTTLADLELLAESVEVECKRAAGADGKGCLPKDFWPSYSAFANTHGGFIVLGLRETEDRRFVAEGVVDAERVVTDLFNTVNNPQKVSANLLTDRAVSRPVIDGKTLIVVDVPAAGRKQRPVYLNGNPFNGNTYRRLHEGDRHCDDETVKRMLAEQIEDERDNRILSGFGMDDIDPDSLRIYRQMLRDEKHGHPFLELDDFEFLGALKGWRRDRQSGESGVTLAGLLMFGRWTALQDALPHYFLDYQERPEARTEKRWVDRLVPDGSWSGNVFDFFRRVYRKLITDLKVPFELKHGQRKEDTPVHVALREALVNTLVHADYSGRVSVLVVKRPDMFGFRNPGGMRVSLDQALRGGESDCRNRLMHQMFLMIGLGERMGSGIPRIFSGWSSAHWRPPSLYVKDEPEQTLLELRMVDLLPEAVIERLTSRFGPAFGALQQAERLIVATAAIERVVSHARVAEISGLHPHDLTLSLQHLVREGFLVTDGRSRGTVYHLPGEQLPTPEQVFGDGEGLLSTASPGAIPHTSGDDVRSSGGLAASSGGLLQSSGGLVASPAGGQRRNGPYGREVPELDRPIVDSLDGLDETYRAELLFTADEVASQGKSDREVVERTVLDLCDFSYLTLGVLAKLLGRSEEYLRKNVLNRLVAEKRLRRAFPSKPNDPRQAYAANTDSKESE